MNPLLTTAEQMLNRYRQGRITSQGLALELLSLTDKRLLLELLEALPADILLELKAFVEEYRPAIKVFRGPRPRPQAVRLVRKWLSRAHQTV